MSIFQCLKTLIAGNAEQNVACGFREGLKLRITRSRRARPENLHDHHAKRKVWILLLAGFTAFLLLLLLAAGAFSFLRIAVIDRPP
jgi:hypothetical protein